MTKPVRKKSNLSATMFTPAEVAPSVEAPAAPQAAAPAEVAATRPTPKAATAPGSKEPRLKVAYYGTKSENERIRAAFIAGRTRYGWRSFSEFQLETMLDRVTQLEAEFNGGRAFDGIPAGEATRGRPIGE